MRKFIAIGATAFTALALTLSPASPAKADVVPPVDLGLITGLCSTLPGTVLNMVNEVLSATAADVAADLASTNAQADLVTSTTALVTAVVAHVLAVNTGGDVTDTAPAVGTTVTDYAAKTVAANDAFDNAVDTQRALNLASSTSSFAGGISAGLCVLPVLPI